MASSPSFGFTADWKRRKVLWLSTRSHSGGLNIRMLKGPRTLPRPSATASNTRWCSGATCSLVVMGVTRGIAGFSAYVGSLSPSGGTGTSNALTIPDRKP